jgi:hypothetical protein
VGLVAAGLVVFIGAALIIYAVRKPSWRRSLTVAGD